jgi:hypothetical protein
MSNRFVSSFFIESILLSILFQSCSNDNCIILCINLLKIVIAPYHVSRIDWNRKCSAYLHQWKHWDDSDLRTMGCIIVMMICINRSMENDTKPFYLIYARLLYACDAGRKYYIYMHVYIYLLIVIIWTENSLNHLNKRDDPKIKTTTL